jgi:uncharacterized protein with ParB-like and HNH nuclease domain
VTALDKEPREYSIEDVLELERNGLLSVNPEYQRGTVWTKAQKKRLVDSVLRGYPLPLFYLHHIKKVVAGIPREDFEVIDGQQRINALYEFMEGAFLLFDPIKDDAEARFPAFIQRLPCPWAAREFKGWMRKRESAFSGPS